MVSPSMHHTKLIAAVLAAVALSAGGVVVFAGGASAAQWHLYEGDVFPGHAYGLPVPAGADAIEIAFQDGGNGSAKVALFDPAGAFVAYYLLGASPSTASFAAPQEGRYILYVYEVVHGALTLRVNADDAPAVLKLDKVPLAREDVVLTRLDAPARLDQIMTAELQLMPVFVTLLYEGSAQDLDATVASTKGAVVTVADESGTAFSPGVWASQTGVRTSEPGNLASGAYTVTATAAQFEGTLVLTSLALDLRAPPEEVPIEDPTPVVPPVVGGEPGAFTLPVREAVAFTATAGVLTLADMAYAQAQAEGEEWEDDGCAITSLILYTPGDEVLAYLQLDGHEPVLQVELPEDGEYVAYVYRSPHDGVVALLDAAAAAPAVRVLPVEETVVASASASTFFDDGTLEFELDAAPIALAAMRDGFGVLESASIENENGVVAWSQNLVGIPGFEFMMGYSQDPSLFAPGVHTVYANGLVSEGGYDIVVLQYVRDAADAVDDDAPEVDEEEDHDHGAGGDAAPASAPAHPVMVERLLDAVPRLF